MRRKLKWIGSSDDAVKRFPKEVRKAVGYALYLAEIGERSPHAEIFKGTGNAKESANIFRSPITFSISTIEKWLLRLMECGHCFSKKSFIVLFCRDFHETHSHIPERIGSM